MKIEQELKNKFPKIQRVFADREFGEDFLRIEVNLIDLSQIHNLAKEINQFLDANDFATDKYFIDVYSPGAEPKIELEQLGNYVGKNVSVVLKRIVKDKIQFDGILETNDSKLIVVRWNNKGQFRNQEIAKENIETVFVSIKV